MAQRFETIAFEAIITNHVEGSLKGQVSPVLEMNCEARLTNQCIDRGKSIRRCDECLLASRDHDRMETTMRELGFQFDEGGTRANTNSRTSSYTMDNKRITLRHATQGVTIRNQPGIVRIVYSTFKK